MTKFFSSNIIKGTFLHVYCDNYRILADGWADTNLGVEVDEALVGRILGQTGSALAVGAPSAGHAGKVNPWEATECLAGVVVVAAAAAARASVQKLDLCWAAC